MLGSISKEFTVDTVAGRTELFELVLPGRTLWRWERRSETGAVTACSERLFPSYVACLCDAQQ